jgi:hypothetical protein
VGINDLLLSHTGTFQKINEIFIKEYNDNDIYHIKVSYSPNEIKCTPEHPFYVREMKNIEEYGNPEWVEAKNLKKTHLIGTKRNKNSIIPTFSFEKSVNKYKKKVVSITLDTHNQWFLLGYFIGNGYVDYGDNNYSRFYISFPLHKEDDINKLLNGLNITHSLKIKNKTTENDKCNTYECYDYKYFRIFKKFGHLAENKKIPTWVHDAPLDLIKSFIDGFGFADGHLHKRNQIQYTTVSKDIAYSIQMLYIKLGEICGLYQSKKPQKESVLKDGRIIKSTKRNYSLSWVINRKKKLNVYLVDEEYVWFKISDIKIKKYEDNLTVYNFEVNVDNSYCVGNLIVHNCARPYIVSESNICDDDLTIQIVEIIKANNHLKIEDGVPLSETKRQKYVQSLKFRVATFYNNSSGKAKHSTNGRPIKGLKERLTGKHLCSQKVTAY